MVSQRVRAVRQAGSVVIALILAGCGRPDVTPPAGSVSPASPGVTPASGATGLGVACATQWAAAVFTYAGQEPYLGSEELVLPVVLLASDGVDPPVVAPTSATLVTDRGPVDLQVAQVWSDPEMAVGTTRVELALPPLEPGTYRAEFVDLADDTGTWRFRVGDVVITVSPDPAPGDLEQIGGTGATGSIGRSGANFEVRLRNATGERVDVTGVTTDIPGLPVSWELLAFDPVRTVDVVAIPAGERATIAILNEGVAMPIDYVLVSPELTYRVADGEERRVRTYPVEFASGFPMPSAVGAYRATLPPDACAQPQS